MEKDKESMSKCPMMEDMDHVVMLSDWTDQNPKEILRSLRRGSEFFGVQKKTAQSVLGAAKTGKLSEPFQREAMRMPAMDLADIACDAFPVNGKPEENLPARPGETIRLRVIDGSASSFFHLSSAGTFSASSTARVTARRSSTPSTSGRCRPP
jgi:FtsP/CotA-like multicopper oxidase with cupredoxin domain